MQPSKQRFSAWLGIFALSLVLVSPLSAAAGAPATSPVDLNNATEQQLENLPGVGKATAAKIIAGRPYASVSDLAKAGVSKATITKISPLVTVGAASSASKSAPTAAADTRASKTAKPAAAPAVSGAKVDINNATEKQLEDLPGVGKATAGKIISGRPYSSVDDLAKSGVSKSTIAKISPLVMVGAASAASKPAAAAPVVAMPTPPPPAPTAAEPAAAPPRQNRRFFHDECASRSPAGGGNGLGESGHQGLSQAGRPLVRQNQKRKVYDGVRCHQGWLPPGQIAEGR